jgi:hypothetical protein
MRILEHNLVYKENILDDLQGLDNSTILYFVGRITRLTCQVWLSQTFWLLGKGWENLGFSLYGLVRHKIIQTKGGAKSMLLKQVML